MPSLVKEAETVAAHGGRSALCAVDFDVLAAGNIRAVEHGITPSP